MRQLHVVALSEDGTSVLLATSKSAKSGGFWVPLNSKLAAAVRGDVPRVGEREARSSDLTPKEIQARLRAGESSEEIAAAAGVPVARVDRFAGPVLAERERIIEEARAGYVTRNRRGPSQLPLGDAVDSALAETSGLRPETVTWTARRLESGHWLVQVAYVARARTRTASWVYEPHTKSVTASDAESAAFGHVGEEVPARRAAPVVRRATAPRPSRPAKKAARKVTKKAAKKAAKKVVRKSAATSVRTPAAKPVATKPVAKKVVAKKAVAKKAAAKKAAAKKAVASKPVAKKMVAKKPVVKKAVAKKAVPKKAATTVAPPKAVATKKPAVRKAVPKPAAKKRATKADPAPVVHWGPPVEPGPPTLRVVPQPPPEPAPEPTPKPAPEPALAPVAEAVSETAAEAVPETAPPPARREARPMPPRARRAAGERAHVPDWADVLLGTAPKRTDD